MSKVALISTKDRQKGVSKAIELWGKNPVKGKDVMLKPNFNTADPFPGSTHMKTLRALVSKLKELKAGPITLAERSGPADTNKVFEEKSVYELANELQFSVVNLAELPVEKYLRIKPENSHWENGFLFSKLYHDAECIVETCCLKTHQFGGHFTLSLKNAVGMVPRRELDGHSYMSELHNSSHQREMIAEINTAFKPDLILIDGITAFVKGGPMKGTRKKANVMLVGDDRVAIDAVGVALLRLLGTTKEVSNGPIFEQDQIRRAVELGLGVSNPSEIELVTESKNAEELAEKIRAELSN